MPNKFELQDYEPVTRTSRSRGSELHVSEDESLRVRPAEDFKTAVELQDEHSNARAFHAVQEKKGSKGEALAPAKGTFLKRGHALTYAGVFLFTLIVFFRPYELIPALSWATSSAFVVAIITLAIYVPTQLALDGRLTVRPREVNLALLLLLACALSIPLALSPLTAWKSFVDFAKVIVIFIVMVNVIRTEKRLKRLLLLVLAASCIISLSALNDYRLDRLALHGRRIEGIIGGLLSNPNDLALHLVTMIPISVGLMLGSKPLLKKALYFGCALLMIAGVVATFSRGGFVGLICVVGMILWGIVRKNRILVFAILAIFAVGFLAVVPGDYRTRLSTTKDNSAIARTDDLKRSIFLTYRNPLFGVGLGNYVFFSNTSKATHNAYTQIGSEIGIAGMVVYILFLVTPLRRLRAFRRGSPVSGHRSQLQWLALGLEASLVGYMVNSFFASVAVQWYAYYLVAYAFCLHRIIENRELGERVGVRREYALPLGNRSATSVSSLGTQT